MSLDGVTQVLDRAMRDEGFRRLLADAPERALETFDLTPDERAAFASGTLRAERLEERISKTDLSAALAAKTSAPLMKPPSESRRRP